VYFLGPVSLPPIAHGSLRTSEQASSGCLFLIQIRAESRSLGFRPSGEGKIGDVAMKRLLSSE
jgi:hypothetical protein